MCQPAAMCVDFRNGNGAYSTAAVNVAEESLCYYYTQLLHPRPKAPVSYFFLRVALHTRKI